MENENKIIINNDEVKVKEPKVKKEKKVKEEKPKKEKKPPIYYFTKENTIFSYIA
jgi:hypothetical protein